MTTLAAVSLVGLTTVPASAASPASGSVNKTHRSTKWSGTFTASYPFEPIPVNHELLPGPTNDCHGLMRTTGVGGQALRSCDHYSLKVMLGEGAQVEVSVLAQNPCGPGCRAPIVDGNDVDLYVYDPSGRIVAPTNASRPRLTVTFVHRKKHNGKLYDIGVRPWLVTPGHSYTGRVKVLSVGKG